MMRYRRAATSPRAAFCTMRCTCERDQPVRRAICCRLVPAWWWAAMVCWKRWSSSPSICLGVCCRGGRLVVVGTIIPVT